MCNPNDPLGGYMNASEGITQKGFGVEYKKVVTVRNDKVATADKNPTQRGTIAAFKAACGDTKKA
jgi:hypothetical protein